MHQPLVCIGLPVFNGEPFVSDAIESILSQAFCDFSLVISDNASTDGTEEICRSYARLDSRITYTRLPVNVGAARNYNRVFSLCSAKFFKWAAHDDVLHPDFLAKCLEVLAAAEATGRRVAIVHPRSMYIDEAGAVVGPEGGKMQANSQWPAIRVFQALQSMNMGSPIFGLMRRDVVGRTGLIRSFVASDYVFLLEAAMLGEIVQIQDDLFLRRIHPGMSRQANTQRADVLRWFDPTPSLPTGQSLYVEYLRAALRLRDLSVYDRSACAAAAILGVSIKRSRVHAGRLRRQIVASFRKGRVD